AAANYEFIHIDIVRCEGVMLSIVKAKCVSAGRELVNRKGTACWRLRNLLERKKSSFARPSTGETPALRNRFYRDRAAAMAWRTFPLVDFNARVAWARLTLACSITSATGTSSPDARKASFAALRLIAASCSRIVKARSRSL